ncbi:ATP-binding protein [Skermanella stibiiresistens]|uniref:ATP-binding protein n=1 Tax=Skermanella stibiiresistens TaxID=913326 RepID=UPI0004B2E81A|nr:ATP-binding protein [Skermanella stibiiresistens]
MSVTLPTGRALTGLLDLAAHVLGAPAAVLCLDVAGTLSTAATSGLDDAQAEALGPDLMALDQLLEGPGVVTRSRQNNAPGSWRGPRIFAGAAVFGADRVKLGSLWIIDRPSKPEPDRAAFESLSRIAGLIGLEIAEQVAMDGRLAAARAEAERATQAKSKFLSSANHDLRQPYQAIHLFLHLLGSKISDPGQQSLVTRIREAVQSAELLLTSLLELSSLDAGNVRPAVTAVNVGEILEKMIREFEPSALEKGLRLRYVPCATEVETDPLLLERMLRQLIGNAVRFTKTGSVMVGCRHRLGRVRVEVWDTGPGIPDEKRPAIFEEFVQLPGMGPRDRGRGLGLGLAIAERTARLLGHGIDVRSRPGKGSVFSITIPRAEAPERAAVADTISVVLIGGDPVQLTSLRLVLENWNCSVDTAHSAEQAEPEAIASADLIIAEVMGGGGTAVLESLRGRAGSRTPIMLIMGASGPERVSDLEGADVSVLSRPFAPVNLRNVMEAALRRQVSGR